ncbi:hypothetical protein MN608_02252 [Microdochium nivale]|nr:hypothetical protein MN608_02252 [Microdochium nivale]
MYLGAEHQRAQGTTLACRGPFQVGIHATPGSLADGTCPWRSDLKHIINGMPVAPRRCKWYYLLTCMTALRPRRGCRYLPLAELCLKMHEKSFVVGLDVDQAIHVHMHSTAASSPPRDSWQNVRTPPLMHLHLHVHA